MQIATFRPQSFQRNLVGVLYACWFDLHTALSSSLVFVMETKIMLFS